MPLPPRGDKRCAAKKTEIWHDASGDSLSTDRPMISPGFRSSLLILALTILSGTESLADDPPLGPGSVTVQYENDRMANTDRHYTHGTRVGWVSEAMPNDWSKDTLSWVPEFLSPFMDNGNVYFGVAAGQNIYTPENIAESGLIDTDRPYAGWLYGQFSLFNARDMDAKPSLEGAYFSELRTLELDLGIVGPQSQAEDAQTIVHEHINVTRPNGWDHQLKLEPGFVVRASRAVRLRHVSRPSSGARIILDVIPHIGTSLGNVETMAKVGGLARIGINTPDDFGLPQIRPSATGPGYTNTGDRYKGIYLFTGIEERLVLRNIFLDGNTFADSHSVDSKRFVTDISAGIAVIMGRLTVAFTHVLRTREFEGQPQSDRFAGLSINFNL